MLMGRAAKTLFRPEIILTIFFSKFSKLKLNPIDNYYIQLKYPIDLKISLILVSR